MYERDIPKKPIRDHEPRWGMGYDYYDWLCPVCKTFLEYEPSWRDIPKRCPECGQLLRRLTYEDVDRTNQVGEPGRETGGIVDMKMPDLGEVMLKKALKPPSFEDSSPHNIEEVLKLIEKELNEDGCS